LGKLYQRPFAGAYQGFYWGNHNRGGSLAPMLHARLAGSPREVADPARAHLLFVPLDSRLTCHTATGWQGDQARPYLERCGYDWRSRTTKSIPDMWKWLLAQRSFAQSDGSDHFIIIEPSGFHSPAGAEPFVRTPDDERLEHVCRGSCACADLAGCTSCAVRGCSIS
jgi:hypothetical protein